MWNRYIFILVSEARKWPKMALEKSKIENSRAKTTEILELSGSRFQGKRNHMGQVFGLLSQFHGQVFGDFDSISIAQ